MRVAFLLRPPALDAEAHTITAAVTVGGRVYTSDVATIRHRDLPVQYLYREARSTVRGVDVTVRPGLKVGYVMGVGDEVPAAIAQLGAEVQLLRESDLASGDLTRFDTIVTGTRAYAVRSDLRTHNARLLEYAKAGGNLVVLYNTPEFTPGTQAPFPASLPQDAEEVCEEQALCGHPRAGHPLLSRPTGSALPISTAGSNSAARSSSRAGMRATRRCCPRTIADSRRSTAACCTPPTAGGTTRIWPTHCTASYRRASRGLTDCWLI